MKVRFHHVQLAIPSGGEDEARAFWVGVLGFEEIAKPLALAERGGAWFRFDGVEVHCGVQAPFNAAAKAHPAFEVDDLDEVASRLTDAGYPAEPDELFTGFRRFYSHDAFGNRLEFLRAQRIEDVMGTRL